MRTFAKGTKPEDDNRPMTYVRFSGLEVMIDKDANGVEYVEFKVPVNHLPDSFNKALDSIGLKIAQTDEIRSHIYDMSIMNVLMAHKA